MDDYSGILLEILTRVQKLENEVEKLKQALAKNVDNISDNGSGENVPPRFATIMLSRQGEVYDDVPRSVNKRDTTKYMLNGNVYLKNRLVYAVVSDYVKRHSNITCDELKETFNKSLQGSIGVVENVEKARLRKDYRIRFFATDDEVLHLVDGDMYVCSQWGIINIPNFLLRAEQLGYSIKSLK